MESPMMHDCDLREEGEITPLYRRLQTNGGRERGGGEVGRLEKRVVQDKSAV